MANIDSSFKNLPSSQTDWQWKWIDALKKRIYPKEKQKKKTLWSKINNPKRSRPNNYRPITCLLMMWKILTAKIREETYNSLIIGGLFPEKQKGCCKWTIGTEDLLYINQHIRKQSKVKRRKCSYDVDWWQKGIR